MKNIITPIGNDKYVPSTDDSVNFKLTGYNKDSFLTKVAPPYNWQGKQIAPIQMKYSSVRQQVS
jgi:hypothetical protein